ncbi:MAG TPA: hypothetical protein VM490_23955, partial [Armatimonadaceae bacterium]|nr:hypothetical protein [Armatimonadaceae bacterium]
MPRISRRSGFPPVPSTVAAFLLALLLALFCAYEPSAAQKPKPLNLGPAIGKDFAAFEKVLGKPALVENGPAVAGADTRPVETRYYRFPGVVRVLLKRAAPEPRVSYVEVQLPKSASTHWRDALKRVGLDPKAATDVFTFADGVSTGMNYKGSRVQWAPRTVEGTRDHRFWIEVNGATKPQKRATVAAVWPPKLAPLAGKGLAQYEALLGRPVFVAAKRRSGPNGPTQEERTYSNDGFGDGPKVILRVESEANPAVRALEVWFPKRQVATGQAALKAVGIPPGGVKAVRTAEGFTALTGVAGLHPRGNLWTPYGDGPVPTEATTEARPDYDVLTLYVPAPESAPARGGAVAPAPSAAPAPAQTPVPVVAKASASSIVFPAPAWQKPYAVAVSPDGKAAEVLAWHGGDGLFRYAWKHPATKLTRVGKVSAGYVRGGDKAKLDRELEGLKAAMAKRLGLAPAGEAKRAALLKAWQAQNAGSRQTEGGVFPRYHAAAISADGAVAVGTDGEGGCFVWRRGEGFANLNAAFGLDDAKFSYQSLLSLSPDG